MTTTDQHPVSESFGYHQRLRRHTMTDLQITVKDSAAATITRMRDQTALV